MHFGNKLKTLYIIDDGNTWIFTYLKYGLEWLIVDPHNDLQPVGLIAQLVEHCTDSAEVRVRIPVQAWIFPAFLAAA